MTTPVDAGEPEEETGPRRGALPGRRLTAMIVVIVAVVYVAVVALYAAGERPMTVGCDPADDDGSMVMLELSPTAVDAAADRISATFGVVSFGPAAGVNRLADRPLTLVVSDLDGPRTFDFQPGDIPAPISVRFITDGEIEQWPFDSHAAQFATVMFEDDGTGQLRPLPTTLCGEAHVPGWTFTSTEVGGGDIVLDGQAVTEVRLVAHRSPATVAFGVIIVLLMVVMPVLGLTVAIRVLRGDRKAEPTLMSWLAAMLFATIPLRTFLPGSPPVGSWVDYLVVLWVVVGLIAALVIYVTAWLKWGPPGGRA